MTKRYLLFLGILFSSTIICGQTFKVKYFTETNWFSNNKDSAFYKSDTLRFIKYSNFGPELFAKEYAESETRYLNHGDFVVLGFKRRKKMDFRWRYDNYISVTPLGPWTWTLGAKTNQLKIYNYHKAVIGTFRPISERQVKIASRFDWQKSLLTTELTLIRIK